MDEGFFDFSGINIADIKFTVLGKHLSKINFKNKVG